MTVLIEASHLYRYYGKNCAVNDVSFKLKKGEVLGFLGPNGAGKSTTMQMLCGNLAPSSGQVKINSIDLLDNPVQAKASLGYLPDTPPLYKELTVQEFLYYCAQLHRIPNAEINRALEKAKDRCGLSDVSKRLIGNLSKGYQQRVGIAQAILHNPKVIVLDEPTVGLDPLQIREIRQLIKELGSDHGIILSTHILTEVQESCTHVQIINQGQLVFNESIAGLNQQMDTVNLTVRTRKAVDLQKLESIPGITSIIANTDTLFTIQHSLTENPIEQVASTIIEQGWGLEELSPVKKSIEDIFITLTQKSAKNTL